MSWALIQSTLKTHLATVWVDGEGEPRTLIFWDNEHADPNAANCLLVTILESGSRRATLTGNPSTGHRFYGTLRIKIRIPAAATNGAADAYALADALTGLFREQIIAASPGRIVFESGVDVGRDPETDKFGLIWQLPFEYDDF